MKHIALLKDQSDYEKVLTDDPVLNLIGTKGSGKTTETLPYIEDDTCIVVNCDRLLELPTDEKEDQELSSIREILKKKYGKLEDGMDFGPCYQEIVSYILNKKKQAIIEGNIIQDMDVSLLRGKVIVKRTGIWKSYVRSVKRDYQNSYFMNLEKEKHPYFYKITRFFQIAKRRKSVFQQAKEIEKIIRQLDEKQD